MYEPPGLSDLIDSIIYKPGWSFSLRNKIEEDGSGGLIFQVVSFTDDSMDPAEKIMVRHNFLVPSASYNQRTWIAWLRNRIADVENHELNEFFKIDGERVFAPHHSNGEDPYLTWFVSDWETAKKRSGDA
jgi:hypothetical protein